MAEYGYRDFKGHLALAVVRHLGPSGYPRVWRECQSRGIPYQIAHDLKMVALRCGNESVRRRVTGYLMGGNPYTLPLPVSDPGAV